MPTTLHPCLTVNIVLVAAVLQGLEIHAGVLVPDVIANLRVENMCTAQRLKELKRMLVLSLHLYIRGDSYYHHRFLPYDFFPTALGICLNF